MGRRACPRGRTTTARRRATGNVGGIGTLEFAMANLVSAPATRRRPARPLALTSLILGLLVFLSACGAGPTPTTGGGATTAATAATTGAATTAATAAAT